jgi:hypothetical protein
MSGLSSIIFRLALIVSALTDFTATVLFCVIFIGIGWAGWYASRLEARVILARPSPRQALADYTR